MPPHMHLAGYHNPATAAGAHDDPENDALPLGGAQRSFGKCEAVGIILDSHGVLCGGFHQCLERLTVEAYGIGIFEQAGLRRECAGCAQAEGVGRMVNRFSQRRVNLADTRHDVLRPVFGFGRDAQPMLHRALFVKRYAFDFGATQVDSNAKHDALRLYNLRMIITSLLDTDLYKFTMMQVVLHHFPGAQVEYRFKCRNAGVNLAAHAEEIREEIDALCTLRFREKELEYLRSMRFIKSDFVDFLGLFQMNAKYITVQPQADGTLEIRVKGPWLHTILFEIPVLSIVNEVYFRNTQKFPDYVEGRMRLSEKIALVTEKANLAEMRIADYGSRRRFSKAWQEEVLLALKNKLGANFAGTSNVHYAMKLGLIPLGTMAHEYLQACQALGPRLRDSQTFGFEQWAAEYRGDLGIALSDVYGINAFLRDFDMFFCKLFDGARHDSGDPFDWGERLIEHYQKNRVDPRTKILVFSDGLNVPLAIRLFERFKGRCTTAFGIGTNLTNDLGYEPLNIVMKMVRCNGQPVAKLSDTPSKNMCDDEKYLAYLRQVFEIPQNG